MFLYLSPKIVMVVPKCYVFPLTWIITRKKKKVKNKIFGFVWGKL